MVAAVSPSVAGCALYWIAWVRLSTSVFSNSLGVSYTLLPTTHSRTILFEIVCYSFWNDMSRCYSTIDLETIFLFSFLICAKLIIAYPSSICHELMYNIYIMQS